MAKVSASKADPKLEEGWNDLLGKARGWLSSSIYNYSFFYYFYENEP